MELKAIYAYTYDEVETLYNRAEGNEYYLKSEADKVIAELKEKHKTEVKELLCLIRDKENNFNRAFDSEEKEIRHHKYKRCLDKAEWCEERCARYDVLQEWHNLDWGREIEFYYRWYKRWLKLADKFKEVGR